MKKAITVVTFLILAFSLSIPCYAWQPSGALICNIDYTQIPENAEYVDLLIPIPPTDDNYTEYNQENGELYDISKDSEIVGFQQDGFMSYTFHFADAESKLKPYYIADFVCDRSYYEANKPLFDKLNPKDVFFFREETAQLLFEAQLGSELDEALEKISSELGRNIEYAKKSTRTEFLFETYDSSDYHEFCKQYEKIKMVYLDKDGNILGISNEVDICKWDLFDRDPQTDIQLNGNHLSCSLTYGPPLFIIFIVFFFIVACAVIMTIVLCIILIVSAIKQRPSV